jgi:hypothetical protein
MKRLDNETKDMIIADYKKMRWDNQKDQTVWKSKEKIFENFNIETETTADKYFILNKYTNRIELYKQDWPKDIIIPTKINWKDIKLIWAKAFYQLDLTTVVLPNKIKQIWNHAFSNNKLIDIDFPNSIKKIWSYSFSNNKLIDIGFPNSIEKIWNFAFTWNLIKKIEIWNNVKIGNNKSMWIYWESFKELYDSNWQKAWKYFYINKNWQINWNHEIILMNTDNWNK